MKLTPSTLPSRLTEIVQMDRTALINAWREVHGAAPPKHLAVGFLRKALTYEAQCAALGGTKIRVVKKLDAPVSTAKGLADQSLSPSLPVGAILIREWNGRTWRVTVTATGFDLNSQHWRSLSAIARHITGAHWSGPRFFGLSKAGGVSKPVHLASSLAASQPDTRAAA